MMLTFNSQYQLTLILKQDDIDYIEQKNFKITDIL
jgi:hypothetical protein